MSVKIAIATAIWYNGNSYKTMHIQEAYTMNSIAEIFDNSKQLLDGDSVRRL